MERKSNRDKRSPKDERGMKLFGAMVMAIVVLLWIGLCQLPTGYHWQGDIPARFGMSLGKFVFYMILIGGLCWTVGISVVLYDRRKKKKEKKGAHLPENKIQMQDIEKEGRKMVTKRDVFEFYTNPGTFEFNPVSSGERTPMFSGKYALYPRKPVPSVESSEDVILAGFNWLFDERAGAGV